MKRNLAIAMISLAICGQAIAQQESKFTKTSFNGQQIMGIDASHIFKIKLSQGENTKATVSIPQKYADNLIFNLKADGTVEVGFRGSIDCKSGELFELDVVCSSLRTIKLSGATSMVCTGNFQSDNLLIELSGIASVNFDDMVTVAGNADIETSGAAKLQLNAHITKELSFESSGACHATLSGKASRAEVELSGAADINMVKMAVGDMIISSSGSAKISASASHSLKVEASGAAKVRYTGSAKVNIANLSGAAKVTPL